MMLAVFWNVIYVVNLCKSLYDNRLVWCPMYRSYLLVVVNKYKEYKGVYVVWCVYVCVYAFAFKPQNVQ